MTKRNFHPKIGQRVYIENNVSQGLEPEHFRESQTIEDCFKVPVDDVEGGFIYSITLKGIPFLFTEFDLKPKDKLWSV